MKCEHCRFWKQDKRSSKMGWCRRYAPRPNGVRHEWPRTENTDWCGDFEPLAESSDDE